MPQWDALSLLYWTVNKTTFCSVIRHFSVSPGCLLYKYPWKETPVQSSSMHLLARCAKIQGTLRVFSPSVWKPEESFGCELILKRGFELFSTQPTYLVFYLAFSLLVNILIFFFPLEKNLCQQSLWSKLKPWDAN